MELVEGYDDICLKCKRRVEDEKGSVWGRRHRCSSSDDPETVRALGAANRRMLRELELEFGSMIGLGDLVALLRERIPVLDDDTIGGPRFQENYEKGLRAISALWE